MSFGHASELLCVPSALLKERHKIFAVPSKPGEAEPVGAGDWEPELDSKRAHQTNMHTLLEVPSLM